MRDHPYLRQRHLATLLPLAPGAIPRLGAPVLDDWALRYEVTPGFESSRGGVLTELTSRATTSSN
jgi:hypothetical protein